MKDKKLWTGFIVVYVVFAVADYIVNEVLMASTYETVSHLFRPEADIKLWVIFVSYLFFAFFFTFIFSKGYEGKGIMEGVRYGLYVGLMMFLPFSYISYAVMPIPYSAAFWGFIYGTVETILCGVAVALVFGKMGKSGEAAA